ncbi:MAG: hypothetical protein V3T70_10975 [Phycisphaerae bacterium]
MLRTAPLDELSPTSWTGEPAALRDCRVLPTPAGLRQPISSLGEAVSSGASDAGYIEAWRRLPVLPTAMSLGTPKPAAEALFADDQSRVLLAAVTVGRGRCVAMGLDATWWWAMNVADGPRLHARFWRQLVVWAANPRPDLYIRSEFPRYAWPLLRAGNRTVRIEARVVDPMTAEPVPHLAVAARVFGPEPTADEIDAGETADDTGRPIRLTRLEDRWIGECTVSGVGAYRLELSTDPEAAPSASQASGGSDSALRAQNRFMVADVDLERDAPEADLDLLRDIAAATEAAGGRYYPLSDFAACLDDLAAADRRRTIPGSSRTDVTAVIRWPLFLMIVGALALEWMIRRRSGVI